LFVQLGERDKKVVGVFGFAPTASNSISVVDEYPRPKPVGTLVHDALLPEGGWFFATGAVFAPFASRGAADCIEI
jgi:hypothetical protein